MSEKVAIFTAGEMEVDVTCAGQDTSIKQLETGRTDRPDKFLFAEGRNMPITRRHMEEYIMTYRRVDCTSIRLLK